MKKPAAPAPKPMPKYKGEAHTYSSSRPKRQVQSRYTK